MSATDDGWHAFSSLRSNSNISCFSNASFNILRMSNTPFSAKCRKIPYTFTFFDDKAIANVIAVAVNPSRRIVAYYKTFVNSPSLHYSIGAKSCSTSVQNVANLLILKVSGSICCDFSNTSLKSATISAIQGVRYITAPHSK